MAADTVSPLLNLVLQGTGNNNNSWGDVANGVFLNLEFAIAGDLTIDLSGGNAAPAFDTSRASTITLIGTLPADRTLTLPATRKIWRIINECSGNFFVLVKTPSGNPVNAPIGKATEIISRGDGRLTRADAHMVGEAFYYVGFAAPAGAIECNNAALKRASAVDLYAKLGGLYGQNDSTDFFLPPGADTGRFLRSRSPSLGYVVGQIQSNQNKSHAHTGSGTTGTESANHTHNGSGTTSTESANHSHTYSGSTGGMSANNPHSHTYAKAITDNAPDRGSQSNNSFRVYQGDTTDPANIEHGHAYSGTTSAQSASHNHTYSFTTSAQVGTHTHSYSFTTSSDGGAEARPESLVGILCVRY